MLNIKDNRFGFFKTFKQILEYDDHKYKEDRLVDPNFKDENIRIVDNVESFKEDIMKYRYDLFESYKNERHKKNKKTDKEINKIFQSTKIMRSFRISINHIELDSLHNPNDSEEKKKENIINFYKNTLNEFTNLLNRNNKYSKENVKIIQVDIHFDQSSPHMHVHVSNLTKKYLKKLNRNITSNNVKISDAINELIQEKKEAKYTKSINSYFADKLKEKHPNENYELINEIDTKKMFSQYYNVYLYKKQNNINNNPNDPKSWRIDKEIYFDMCKKNLEELNLEISENDCLNAKKINDLTLFAYKQSLSLLSYDKDKEFMKSWLCSKEVKNLILDDKKLIQTPKKLIYKEKDNMYKNIHDCVPELESIENELVENLNIYENKETNVYYEHKDFKNVIYEEKNNVILDDNEEHYVKQKNIDDIQKEIEYQKWKQKYK